jgi:hypothetical protein
MVDLYERHGNADIQIWDGEALFIVTIECCVTGTVSSDM